MTHNRTVLLLGCGYVAKATAPLIKSWGARVVGTVRSMTGFRELRGLGIEPIIWSGDDVLPVKLQHVWQDATHILVSIPPGQHGDPVLERVAEMAVPRLEWLGYLSTTGVYGDRDGGWVTEATAPEPVEPRSVRRFEAENGWRAYSEKTRLFRLSGIYGPGRSALDQMKAGRARRIVKEGQVFSRIHVEDIARTLLASMRQPGISGPFNLADDEPAAQAEVVAYAAGLLGVEPPVEEVFETAEMSEMMRSFFSQSRRVSGRATRQALGVELIYPTYREGLQALAST